jgi:hypothetical protein
LIDFPAIIMGVVAGTLFWQTDDPNSIVSIIFQSMFYAALAQMTLITKQFPFRSIFYKQQDANFFPTWSYVIGRSIATIPIACTDALGYGTVIYFFVGLGAPYNGADSISNFFVFLLIVFEVSLTTGLFFGMYSAAVKVVTIAQACMALTGKYRRLFVCRASRVTILTFAVRFTHSGHVRLVFRLHRATGCHSEVRIAKLYCSMKPCEL